MESASKQIITITDRKNLSMGGVKDIRGFDEDSVILETELGRLQIEGRELRIESLSKDGGSIMISGEIDALYFIGEAVKKKGIFSK